MSWVANVMISVGVDDTESAEALSEWLRTEAPLRSSPERGGVGCLRLLPWREATAAQLFVMDQEEGFFWLWMIRGAELRQFASLVPREDDEVFYRERRAKHKAVHTRTAASPHVVCLDSSVHIRYT